jgi:hypothetical protein
MLWLSHELFTVPVLVSFGAVLVLQRDFIHPKYMVFSAPFFLLGLAAAFLSIDNRYERAIVAITGAAVFAVSFAHLNQSQAYGRREDWRGAAQYLRTRLDDDSVLLWLGTRESPDRMTASDPPKSLWEYYGSDLFARARVVQVPRPDTTPAELAPVLTRRATGVHRVYYLWSEILANVDDPGDAVLAAAREDFVAESRVQFNPRLVLYAWDVK